jgi:hypothetical protein
MDGRRTARPLYPLERVPLPIAHVAGWAPGQVWTDAEIIAPTGIRSSDRTARSDALYRLRQCTAISLEDRSPYL